VSEGDGRHRGSWVKPFLAGMVATGAGWVIAETIASRRQRIDRRLVRRAGPEDDVAPVVVVPGIMGSGLHRSDGTQVWLNLRNAVGQYNLGLPLAVPLAESRDELIPGALLGAETMMPRLFGFTEYYDLLEMLELVGFRASGRGERRRPVHHVLLRLAARPGRVRRAGCTRRWRSWPRRRTGTAVNWSATAWAAWSPATTCATAPPSPRPTQPVTRAGARRIRQPHPGGGAQRGQPARARGPCCSGTGWACPTRRWPRA
jgi:hypothetical protein